jgi:glutathione transport system substrate-binding protein
VERIPDCFGASTAERFLRDEKHGICGECLQGLLVGALTALVLMGAGCGHPPPPGSRITIMQSEAPLTMDPGDQTASLTADVLSPMYEGLTRFGKNLSISPSLAASWTIDSSGTRWTFHLRHGVRFQDGTPFSASAVVHSYERLMNPTRGLAGGSRIRGVLATVTVLDPYTVLFTLARPYAPFLRLTAVTWIVSPTADAAGILARHAVGTGPYRLVSWNTGESVLEQRNPDYWGLKPAVKQLLWTWSTEPVLMNMSVLADQADIVNPLPPIFAQALASNRRVRLIQGRETTVFWVALNMQTKVLADIRVRKALSYATDRGALVRTQLRGFGSPANSPLSPAEFGYNAGTRGYNYDPARAMALLRQAGYGGGLTLSIAVQEEDEPVAEALQGMWANVGVHLVIDQMEHGVYSQAIFGSPVQKKSEGIDCVLASWASGDGDPDYQLSPLYRTDAWSPAGANLGFYGNPKLDALLTRAAAELDINKRKALYAQAQQIIEDDAPHVLLYYTRDLAAEHAGSVPEALRLLPGGQIDLSTR